MKNLMIHNCTLVEDSRKIFTYRYPNQIVEVLELLENMGYYYLELPPILPISCELFYPASKNFAQKGEFYIASMGVDFHILPSVIKDKGILSCFCCVSSIEKQGEIIYIEAEVMKEESISKLLQYTKQKRISHVNQS